MARLPHPISLTNCQGPRRGAGPRGQWKVGHRNVLVLRRDAAGGKFREQAASFQSSPAGMRRRQWRGKCKFLRLINPAKATRVLTTSE